MNGTAITMMPTMCNPEKLSHEELIEQYKYMEEAAFKQVQELHDMKDRLSEMSETACKFGKVLTLLVDSYQAGDQAAILLSLKKMSEQRKSVRASKGKVH